MAISPPSDILLDVATAADPAKVRAATERLAKLAADPAAKNDGFSKALAAASKPGGAVAADPKAPAMPVFAPTIRAAATVKPRDLKADTYQKFEGLLLQNFVESMLPKDEELFGDKASSGPYRSMLAEQLASQLAKSGGIGIAKMMAAKTTAAAHPQLAHAQMHANVPAAANSLKKVG